MLAFLSGPLGKLAEWGAAILAALGALFTVYETVKGSGVQEQQTADLKEGLKNVQVATSVEQAVAIEPAATVDTELRASYQRD